MKFFSPDGALYKFISKLWDIIQLSVFWILFSIPVITFGGATVAAFKVTNLMACDNEGYIFREFFNTFKKEFRNGIVHGLLFLIGLYCLYLDWQITLNASAYEGLLLAFSVIATAVFYALFVFSFSLRAGFNNSLVKTLKNSYRICIRYFGRVIIMTLALALEFLIFDWNTLMLMIGLFVAPGFAMYTISSFAIPIYRQIDEENKSGDADE
ncbi:MAG: DUF624 domain-containing protein [Lachnospiraceae bacterium]|nr:DUF624 domain-containing protein [Lachnospiraceae bacterium]